MKAGLLRLELQIQEKTVVKDDFGGETITFVNRTDGAVRGSIKYLSGQDGFSIDQFFGKNVVEFRMRFTTISVTDRIVFDGRNFDIIPPIKNSEEKNRDLIITAEEEAQ